MSNKKNPKLNVGDRIILIYMPGEDIDTGTKGKVTKIGKQPSFDPESNYLYEVQWYDDDDKVISNLSLLPQSDTWMLDPEFNSKNIHEARFTELDDLIKHHEWSKLFKKSDLTYILDYLRVIRDLGVVNMMEAGQFLGQTKEYLTKYFDLHRMQRELDDDKEELIEKIIDMSDKVRNIMISASITDLERKNQEITGRSATNRINRLAGEILRWYIKSFY
jgi:hypothetical protein